MLGISMKETRPDLGILPPGERLLARQHVQPLTVRPHALQPSHGQTSVLQKKKMGTYHKKRNVLGKVYSKINRILVQGNG